MVVAEIIHSHIFFKANLSRKTLKIFASTQKTGSCCNFPATVFFLGSGRDATSRLKTQQILRKEEKTEELKTERGRGEKGLDNNKNGKNKRNKNL